MNDKRFNVRVYGIATNNKDEILVSDELIRGLRFTKFPGGGLEWGEGTRACLEREFIEELNQRIEVLDHFYTTDYFQQSAFKEYDQLLSIYYKVRLLEPIAFEPRAEAFDFPENDGQNCEVQRWLPRLEIEVDHFRWPVDRIVAEMLKAGR